MSPVTWMGMRPHFDWIRNGAVLNHMRATQLNIFFFSDLFLLCYCVFSFLCLWLLFLLILFLPWLFQLELHFRVLSFLLFRLVIVFFTFRYLLVILHLLFALFFVSSSALPYTSTSVSSSALFLLLGLFQAPSPSSFVFICVFSSTSYSSLSFLFFRWLLWRVRHRASLTNSMQQSS